MGCLSLLTANVMFVNNTVYFLLLIFSGANVDINILPSWMQALSQRAAANSWHRLRAGADRRRRLQDMLPLLVQELGIGLVYGLLGYFLFKWVEVSAKRRGTLETI